MSIRILGISQTNYVSKLINKYLAQELSIDPILLVGLHMHDPNKLD